MKKEDFLQVFNEHILALNNFPQENFRFRKEHHKTTDSEQIVIELIKSENILEDDYGAVGAITIQFLDSNIEQLTLELLRGNGKLLSRAEFDAGYDSEIIVEYLSLFFRFLQRYSIK